MIAGSITSTDKAKQEIINGDCLQVMDSMDAGSVDVVCTSPPYNIGIKYNSYKDNLKYNDYLNWMTRIGQSIKRILKSNGSLFLNVGFTNTKPFLSLDIASAFRESLLLQNKITWAKAFVSDKPNNSFGHYKPINSNRYLNNLTEDIFHFTKEGNNKIDRLAIGVPYKWKDNLKSRSTGKMKPDLKCRGNIWFIPYETKNRNSKNEYYHPASFPVLLPERCIKLHGINSDMVAVDPFMGIGTTLMACQKIGVRGIGIDIDKHYCDTAQIRLGEEWNVASYQDEAGHYLDLENNPLAKSA